MTISAIYNIGHMIWLSISCFNMKFKDAENGDCYGNSYVWEILIPRLDFRTQKNLAQQNRHIHDVVKENAEYELKKLKKKISDNKFM